MCNSLFATRMTRCGCSRTQLEMEPIPPLTKMNMGRCGRRLSRRTSDGNVSEPSAALPRFRDFGPLSGADRRNDRRREEGLLPLCLRIGRGEGAASRELAGIPQGRRGMGQDTPREITQPRPEEMFRARRHDGGMEERQIVLLWAQENCQLRDSSKAGVCRDSVGMSPFLPPRPRMPPISGTAARTRTSSRRGSLLVRSSRS